MLQVLLIVAMGLGVGILVGLVGVGGGIVIVPALTYLLHMDQRMAQGTSLFLLLPPIGLGALYAYWRQGKVDWRVGMICAAGLFIGGYFGSWVAVRLPLHLLRALFGLFLIYSAIPLWHEPAIERKPGRMHE